MKPIDGDDAEQLEEVFAHIKKARFMIVSIIDAEDHLIVIRKGIPEAQLCGALRHFADTLENIQKAERAVEAVRAATEAFEQTPPERKAFCPGCEAPVILVTPLPPPEMMRNPHIKARCVCSCGAFLVPYYVGEALALRLMSVEEIADTPDEIRNNMLGIRRRMAAANARRKREAN